MKRRLLLTISGLVLLACALPARPAIAAVDVGVSIRTGGHHQGGISLNFRSRPDVVLIPRSRVYYVQNYDRDLYRYDNDWYYVEDGYWYRAPSYRGPFIEVSYSSVPSYVRSVPVRYRRHWGGSGSSSYGYRNDRSGIYRNRSGAGYGNSRDRGNVSRDRQTSTRNRGDSNQGRGDQNQGSQDQGRGNRDRSHNRGNSGR